MMIVCPLTVLLAFMSLAAKLGNPDVAREFFLSATVVLALFGVGLVVRAILRQTHGRESRDRLERIAATSTTFAVWGVVAVSVVLIPALSRAKNGPVSTAPEEASLRAALDGAGADIVLDTHGQIRSIELCDASDDQILGVGTLPRVSGIFIHGEGVTDAGMAYIAHLQDLETLDISATRVTSVGIRWIRGFSHLKVLNLSKTDVDDSGLAHVKDLRELQVLLLSGTKVTDVGMMHLAGLRALKTLHLNGTAISGK